MHYRQTIIDTLTQGLQALPSLNGAVSSAGFYPADVTPSARVWITREDLPEDMRYAEPFHQERVATVQIKVLVASRNVQQAMNVVLEEVEGAVPTILQDAADCAWLTSMTVEIAAEQETETATADLDYAVHYKTAIGDPSQRV